MSDLLKLMLPMKISNWESIKYSEGICCPNPECDNDGYYNDARNILGWCETPSGFMYVCECNKCFTKYRFHGVTGSDKFNLNKFARSFLLSVLLKKDKDDPSFIDLLQGIKSIGKSVELKKE